MNTMYTVMEKDDLFVVFHFVYGYNGEPYLTSSKIEAIHFKSKMENDYKNHPHNPIYKVATIQWSDKE